MSSTPTISGTIADSISRPIAVITTASGWIRKRCRRMPIARLKLIRKIQTDIHRRSPLVADRFWRRTACACVAGRRPFLVPGRTTKAMRRSCRFCWWRMRRSVVSSRSNPAASAFRSAPLLVCPSPAIAPCRRSAQTTRGQALRRAVVKRMSTAAQPVCNLVPTGERLARPSRLTATTSKTA